MSFSGVCSGLWSHDPWEDDPSPAMPMARIHPQPEDKHCIKTRPGQARPGAANSPGHNNRAGLKRGQDGKGKDRATEYNQWHRQTLEKDDKS